MTARNVRQLFQIEIRTRDIGPAVEFYKHVFDWTLHRYGDFAIIDTGIMPVGAIATYPGDSFPLGVGNYILAEDCEADGKRAVALGGRICVQKYEVEGSGYYVGTLDPWGNELFFWQPHKAEVPTLRAPRDNHFCWIEIPVADLGIGIAYYNQLLAWRFRTVPGTPDYAITEDGGLTRGVGLIGGERGRKMRGITNYVSTPNLSLTETRIIEAGGTILMGPVHIPDEGSFLVFKTPEGLRMAAFAAAGTAAA